MAFGFSASTSFPPYCLICNAFISVILSRGLLRLTSAFFLLLVILHDLRGTNLSHVGVYAGSTKCPTLPQKIPTLVQLDLHLGEPLQVRAFGRSVSPLLEQAVLFFDEFLDVREHRAVCGLSVVHKTPSFLLSLLGHFSIVKSSSRHQRHPPSNSMTG